MRVHPLFGAGIAGKSLVVTAQRRVNCYFENRKDKDRTPIACYGTPGMKFAFTIGALANSPVRGMLGTSSSLYSAVGNTFFQNNSAGVQQYTQPGALASTAGFVSFAFNPNQVMLVDGVKGYVYQSGVVTAIADANYNSLTAPTTNVFVGGYFVVNVPGTQQFNVSNFYDGTVWPPLAFNTASGYPDNLIAVDSLLGNLILFCGLHTEFWQNIGTTPQPFAPINSATTEWGLAAVAGRVHADSKIYFLAASPQGGYSICEVAGYQVNVVSDPDLDYIIDGFSTVTDCVALAYRADQHAMAQFTFPTAGRSFLFDCSTRLWSETQTGVPVNTYALRHTGQYSALVASKLVISDYATNNIYTPDPLTYTDNGVTIVRELVTKHEDKDYNVFSVDEFFCDFETGVGLSSGQGSNPQVQISCSKDDRTFLTPLYFPLGKQGQFVNRVVARRWGSARRFTWQVYMTDPVKWALTSVAESKETRQQDTVATQ